MSCLQVTTVRPSLRAPNQHNTLRGSAIQCISPVNFFNLHNALKSTIGSSKKCTNLMRCHVMQRSRASRYQQCCMPLCLFGGKGESKNGDEGSPWKSIEKAMSSFKKEQSLEDVLRQQIEKKDYYDGGSGENPPGGGGGGGGGFGEPEDEGFAGILDDILQVTLAILALVALYLNIVAGDQVMLFLTDAWDFVSGKKGPRLRSIMYDIGKLYQTLNTRVPYDPYWLEKAIITTPTVYDGPLKYERILKSIRRASKGDMDSDDDSDGDDKALSYTTNTNDDDDDSDNYNANYEDSDNDNAYRNKAYNDDEDIDDDF